MEFELCNEDLSFVECIFVGDDCDFEIGVVDVDVFVFVLFVVDVCCAVDCVGCVVDGADDDNDVFVLFVDVVSVVCAVCVAGVCCEFDNDNDDGADEEELC